MTELLLQFLLNVIGPDKVIPFVGDFKKFTFKCDALQKSVLNEVRAVFRKGLQAYSCHITFSRSALIPGLKSFFF